MITETEYRKAFCQMTLASLTKNSMEVTWEQRTLEHLTKIINDGVFEFFPNGWIAYWDNNVRRWVLENPTYCIAPIVTDRSDIDAAITREWFEGEIQRELDRANEFTNALKASLEEH